MALWFFSPEDDAAAWRAALQSRLPDLAVETGGRPAAPDAIRYALVFRPPPGALAALPRLEAVFSLAAGVDRLLADPTLPPVPVCRMVDPALEAAMADYVHLALLRVQRGFDVFEHRRDWFFAMPRLAAETGVAVLGLGRIGAAVAARLAAHGYRVTGWSRTAKRLAGVATYEGPDGLAAAVAEADVVVGLLPATPATRDIFDAAFFQLLRPGAHFVNVGRGEHVVDGDLLAALDAGRLAGATLDVFRTEPLPAGHPYWEHPQVLVTPHVAAITRPETGAAAVAENIRRARDGRPLLHVVDRDEGY